LKASDFIKNQFILYSLFAFILYAIISGLAGATPHFLVLTLMNLVNALGGLLLIAGLYDVTMKEKYQRETTNQFVKTLFLEDKYIDSFNDDDLIAMMGNIQRKLLNVNKNKDFKDKVLYLINSKILPLGRGKLADDYANSIFEDYDENVVMKQVKIDEALFIEFSVSVKYKLLNNSDKKSLEQEIFTRKFIDKSVESCSSPALVLNELEITIDGKHTKYTKTMIDDMITLIKDIETPQNTISNTQTVMFQFQEKYIHEPGGEEVYKPFTKKFYNSIQVAKKYKVLTPIDDVIYGHLFHRPIMNFSIRVRDESATKLTGMLRSAFHKRNDDKISIESSTPNEVEIKLKNDLLLPQEGVVFFSQR